MRKTFVIADTHFGHANIIKYENRPFENEYDMRDQLIKNWNNKVSKGDVVYILGDFSFYNKFFTSEIIRRLNGSLRLVMGNHDRGHSVKWWLEAGMDEVYRFPVLYKNEVILSHEPLDDIGPFKNIYGHVHSDPQYETITNKSACISLERWGYEPVEIEKVIEMMEGQEMSGFIKDGKRYVCLDDYVAVKLWSEEDVRSCVFEKYPEYNDEQVKEIVSEVINSRYLNALEDCTDEDWGIINFAIDEIHRIKQKNRNSNGK